MRGFSDLPNLLSRSRHVERGRERLQVGGVSSLPMQTFRQGFRLIQGVSVESKIPCNGCKREFVVDIVRIGNGAISLNHAKNMRQKLTKLSSTIEAATKWPQADSVCQLVACGARSPSRSRAS